MCDVIDRKTLLYLLRTVTHQGGQALRELIAGLGVLWLVSKLADNCRVLAEWIIGKARERGRGMQLSWRQVAWEFIVGQEEWAGHLKNHSNYDKIRITAVCL